MDGRLAVRRRSVISQFSAAESVFLSLSISAPP
jgi:hypothetical protein